MDDAMNKWKSDRRAAFTCLVTTLFLYGCESTDTLRLTSTTGLENFQTTTSEPVQHQYYDGNKNDLLTAGLGIAGLQAKAPPAFADPLSPTVAELRRNRIHYHYNSIVNTDPRGGFGHLYGPKAGTEKIAGHEYMTTIRYLNGDIAATLMVQIPDSFNTNAPCIVTAPSSGSRGVYGAIGSAGQWGLSKGCAVAYTDKGTGTGFYIGDQNRGYDLLGRLVPAADALFAPAVDLAPHRIAVKHSHSGHNVEKDWGMFVLQAIQFAFRQLNQLYAPTHTYTRDNTLVIASSISNGGGSSLKAAEQDEQGWIDAVVVAEPSMHFGKRTAKKPVTVTDSGGVIEQPRQLLDTATHFALYQGCASVAVNMRSAPLAVILTPPLRQALEQRCQALKDLGLLRGNSLEQQARAAQQKLLDYGLLPQALQLGAFSTGVQLWEAIAVTYGNAYGRYNADKPLCDISFAYTDSDGNPAPIPPELAAGLVTVSSGIVPMAGIQLINDRAGGVALHSPGAYRQGQENTLQALLCLRKAYQSDTVQQGIRELAFNGNLGGKPAIIVHGRHDNLIQVNHSSRHYLALNREQEGEGSALRYYEITHGQHFDALLRLPGFSQRYVPLHYYFEQALELMWSHLTRGTALPPSQVVYARPARAGGAAELPPIKARPEQGAIRYSDGVIHIP